MDRTRSPVPLIVLVALGSALAGGCEPSEPDVRAGTPEREPFEVRDSSGVRIVTNHAPQWDEGLPWEIDPEPRIRIGGEDPEVGQLIWRVIGAHRLGNGNIAALVGAQTSRRIVILDRSGGLVRTIGGPGEGPGEFIEPIHLQRLPGDTLVTWERHFGRVTSFDTLGNHLAIRHLDRDRLGAAVRFGGGGARLQFALPGGAYVVSGRRPRTPLAEREIGSVIRDTVVYVRMHEDYSADTLGYYAGMEEYTREGPDGRPDDGRLLVHRASGVSAGGTPLRIVVGTGEPQEGFHVFDESGTLERIVRRTTPEIPLDEEDRRHLIDFLVRVSNLSEERMATARRGMQENFPPLERFPSFGLTYADARGYYWVADRYLTATGPPLFSVFDPEGIWLGQVEIPVVGQILEIGDDYLLMHIVDELGIEYLQEHELRRGSVEQDQ